jgi:hypothetical protein
MAKAPDRSAPCHADPTEMHKALSLLHAPGSVVELRIPDTGRAGTVAGYFDDVAGLIEAAARWSGHAPAIYITLNACKPALLARAANRLIERANQTTADHDIVKRHWLPLAFDPVRPTGISSTDGEHEAALAQARACINWLHRQGWPEPVYADSGNGAHVLYPIDLPNDGESAALVQRCVEVLAFRFSDQEVGLDLGHCNAGVIWTLSGTMACIGEHLPDRPHRPARLLDVPASLQAVSIDHLARLAALPTPHRAATSHQRAAGHLTFDRPRWIPEHGPWHAGGPEWVSNPCPWNPAHTKPLQETVARHRVLHPIHAAAVLDPDRAGKLKRLFKRLLVSVGHRLVGWPSRRALFTRVVSVCGLSNV